MVQQQEAQRVLSKEQQVPLPGFELTADWQPWLRKPDSQLSLHYTVLHYCSFIGGFRMVLK